MEPSSRSPPSTVSQLPVTLRLVLPRMKLFDMTKNDQYSLGESGGIAVKRKEKKKEHSVAKLELPPSSRAVNN